MNTINQSTFKQSIIAMSIVYIVLAISYYGEEIFYFFESIYFRKDIILEVTSLFFKPVLIAFVSFHLILFALGRNMYTWNENSNAKKTLDEVKEKINLIRKVFSFLFFLMILFYSFQDIISYYSLSSYDNILFNPLFIAQFLWIGFELHWALFKLKMANLAAKEFNNVIDGRSRIKKIDGRSRARKINGEYIFKSYWKTIYGESGTYYYEGDYNIASNKWETTKFTSNG